MKNFSTNKFSGLLLSVGLACLLYSCNKNDGLTPEEKSIEPVLIEQVDYDPKLEAVAKALAASMGEESVRTLIKTEAQKKFDGDYDVLYQHIDKKSVSGKSFASIMAQNAQKANVASRTMPFNELTSQIPLLNISVPVNIDKWNTSSFEPLVVVQSNVKDESKLKYEKAFDKNGNIHWLDAQKAPDFPVIVVGLSERIEIVNGVLSLKKGIIDNLDSPVLNYVKDGGDSGGGGGGGSTPPPPTGCRYADNAYLYLTGISSPDISVYESWARGVPEITYRVFAPSNGNFSSLGEIRAEHQMQPPSRSSVSDNNWWNPNRTIVYWNPASYGQTFVFSFLEIDDSGDPMTANISSSFKTPDGSTVNLSTNFSYKSNDDLIGTMAIDKCANPPVNYDYYDISQNFNIRLGN